VNLLGKCSIRMLEAALAAGLCLGMPGLLAQSTQPPPPSAPASQKDNPFPGDAPQAPAPDQPPARQPAPQSASQNPGQDGNAKPDPAATKPKPGSDNPFPGEDPNAPIIPVDPGGPATGAGAASGRGADSGSGADSGPAPRRDADPNGDPVRSPDPQGNYANDDGFSSSRAGLKPLPEEDDSDAKPDKGINSKTRQKLIKEDLDVGGFYLDKKNWKAAQGRFSSAFALDAENPDSVWGLAEAERHLQLYKEAAEHYKLFLSYEPEGKRGREARKALEEVEAAQPSASATSKANAGVK
jgi:hypothetical protein